MKRNSMKKSVLWLAALTTAFVIGVVGFVLAQDKLTITTIVKITGINWFNRMEEGVKQYASESGNDATQTGPAQADAAQQLKVIQDTLARNPDAIAVVPFDPATLEPVFKEALDRGIKVITHEADSQVNTLYDIEAFDNVAFGGQLNQRLADCMGGEGKWTVFVGSLGSKTHNQWADGGIENAAANNAGMELVDAKQETFDDADKAYEKAKEILAKYPDIKGFQGSASTDVAGIGRAIEEAGLQDTVCVYGTSLPSIAGKFIETGAVDGIGFWDPKDAGMVMNKVAEMVIAGTEITEGMDLGVPGYNAVKVVPGAGAGKVIYGEAYVFVDAANLADYPF
jgi:simple sugar transport system substrate-binding protein